MSNLGKWNRWYSLVDEEEPFGLTPTYQLGADYLADCATVEDWGCGKGWMRKLVEPERYRGIDGSWSRFADEVVDLEHYRSDVEGLFMRHVLEHNYGWRRILANAVASFSRRLVLVIFTPMGEATREIAFAPDPGVPDISFAVEDITGAFNGHRWSTQSLETATQHGVETIFLVEKAGHHSQRVGEHSALEEAVVAIRQN